MKTLALIATLIIAVGVSACDFKNKDDKSPKPPAKIEFVQKKDTKAGSSTTPAVEARLNALEKRVGSLEVSRSDVRKYLKQKEIELKAKGF